MLAERASTGEVSNINDHHKDAFTKSRTCILKVRMDGINSRLRALCLAEEPAVLKRGTGSRIRTREVTVTTRSKIRKLFINYLTASSRKADRVTVPNKSKTQAVAECPPLLGSHCNCHGVLSFRYGFRFWPISRPDDGRLLWQRQGREY